MKTKTNLIVDLSNVVFIVHHSSLKKNNGEFSKEFLLFKTVQLIKYIALMYKVDGILIACDSKNVWRKDLYPEYKANRNHATDPYYDDVKDVINDVIRFFDECTMITTMSVNRAEADDIIAIVTQTSNAKSVILSSDKDFIQLINDKTVLYSPTSKAERVSEDREYELFEKCIRGDRGDNIPSAYPNIRSKKLQSAWYKKINDNDNFEMVNIMETVKNGVKVSDAFNFNNSLINLTMQPDFIKERVKQSINNIEQKKYNNSKLLRFIGEYNLKGVSDDLLKHKYLFKKCFVVDI
ncbi:MAG: hypothetical protein OEZ38_11435 [Gammaproteobacteria bacterium]|nr:hypothetical protein [Gammaproteobacteria bacterium]